MSAKPVTILDFLNRSKVFLERQGMESPRLDAEVLLAHVMDCTRLDLYVRFEKPLSPGEIQRYRGLIQERGRGVPVAYLTNRREFFSLDFHVTPHVLIPRPETEHLVEAALEALGPEEKALVVDAGAGSGCVGIALARNRPGIHVIATDVSREALNIVGLNARRLQVADRISLLLGDLLEGLAPRQGGRPVQLILSNPPYVPLEDWNTLPRDVRTFEPQSALVARQKGTEFHTRLIRAAERVLVSGGALYMEIGHGQAEIVAPVMQKAFGNVEVREDLAGISRIIGGKKP